MKLRPSVVILLALAAAAPAHAGAPVVSWPLEGSPSHITAAPNGYLYWTEPIQNKLGYRSPSGSIGEIDIPTPSSWPTGIAAAPDGTIWFAENYGHKIGRYNPNAIVDPITEYPLLGQFHSPSQICAGPDGTMWFTVLGGWIGQITLSGSMIIERAVPTADAQPYGIALGEDGALWFTELAAGKIGRIVGASITEYALQAGTNPQWMTRGSDGNLWFLAPEQDLVGRVSRSLLGAVTIAYYPVPTASRHPNAIAAGPDGALWFTSDLGSLTRLTTSGKFDVFSVGGGTTITGGRDGALWIGDSLTHTLSRFSMSGDVNRGSGVNVADVFALINYLFAGGAPPL